MLVKLFITIYELRSVSELVQIIQTCCSANEEQSLISCHDCSNELKSALYQATADTMRHAGRIFIHKLDVTDASLRVP